nr:metal-dependent hydrolase [Halosegnis sp. DT85]
MVITHVAVALLAASAVAVAAPEFAAAAAVGAYVGGTLPDIDLFVGVHRRTLHFPVLGPALAVPAVAVALVVPSDATVAVAVALVGAGVHAASDALGAGEELRPWERTNPNAVYDHASGRWWRARYLVPYDGSPRDLAVAVLAAVPTLLVYDGPVAWVLAGLLVAAALYTAVRRRVVPYFEAML